MVDTVRRSKITPPRLPAAPVARPRVDALLDAAAAKPVTLVSASAGYGKTIAVEAWLTARRVPAAWVSVDAHDDDALHLWRYVIASVERALPGFDETPRSRVLTAEGTAEPTIEVLLAALEDDGRPLTIVLDDLHLADRPARARLAEVRDGPAAADRSAGADHARGPAAAARVPARRGDARGGARRRPRVHARGGCAAPRPGRLRGGSGALRGLAGGAAARGAARRGARHRAPPRRGGVPHGGGRRRAAGRPPRASSNAPRCCRS